MQGYLRGLVWPSVILFGCGLLQGCRSGDSAGDEQPTAIPSTAATFQLRGIVVTSDAAKGVVTVDSEAIPGLMSAMTMPFKLLNQSGKTIAVDQFRGKVLLVTFIYTRCPLPDYCIRLSRNFANIQHQLAADPKLYNKTHLLSISFDPAHDTPKV